TVTGTVSLTIVPMVITTVSLPNGLVQRAYPSLTLKVTGGKGALTWTTVAGTGPAGLEVSAAGGVRGTPAGEGSFTFTVKVTDSSVPKNSATKQFTLVIAPMTVLTTTLPNGKVWAGYGATLQVNGGKTPITWTVTSGALPPGLRIQASNITGFP